MSLTIPNRIRPTEIGYDYLVRVSIDSLGVERVEVYGLSRTDTSPG